MRIRNQGFKFYVPYCVRRSVCTFTFELHLFHMSLNLAEKHVAIVCIVITGTCAPQNSSIKPGTSLPNMAIVWLLNSSKPYHTCTRYRIMIAKLTTFFSYMVNVLTYAYTGLEQVGLYISVV